MFVQIRFYTPKWKPYRWLLRWTQDYIRALNGSYEYGPFMCRLALEKRRKRGPYRIVVYVTTEANVDKSHCFASRFSDAPVEDWLRFVHYLAPALKKIVAFNGLDGILALPGFRDSSLLGLEVFGYRLGLIKEISTAAFEQLNPPTKEDYGDDD